MKNPVEQPETRFVSEGNPNTKEHINDEQLVVEVKNAFEKEGLVFDTESQMQVTAKGGVLTLEGRVDSEEEKTALGEIASAFGETINQLEVSE